MPIQNQNADGVLVTDRVEQQPIQSYITTCQGIQRKLLISMVPTEGVEPTHPHGY
jgi:hypothetical protein